jgi:hypothetical protein
MEDAKEAVRAFITEPAMQQQDSGSGHVLGAAETRL